LPLACAWFVSDAAATVLRGSGSACLPTNSSLEFVFSGTTP